MNYLRSQGQNEHNNQEFNSILGFLRLFSQIQQQKQQRDQQNFQNILSDSQQPQNNLIS